MAAPTEPPTLETVRGRALVFGPFVGAFALAFVLAIVSPGGPHHWGFLIAAIVLNVAISGSLVGGTWLKANNLLSLVPVVAICVDVDLLRASSTGGSAAGYGSLLLIPVIWQAMRREQRELLITVVCASIANIVAVVFLPSTLTAAAQWRGVIMFTVVVFTMGQTIHKLVSDRNVLLDQIRDLAERDALTGLPNRRSWDERLPIELELAARRGDCLAVAILDLDHFKLFNDRRGHQAGDELLAGAAKVWGATLRAGDLLVRWGGEEFAILMPAADADEAAMVLERLQAATPEFQSFSAGYTVVRPKPLEQIDLVDLIATADHAMYAAKADGRARTVYAGDLDHEADRPPAKPVAKPLAVPNGATTMTGDEILRALGIA